MRSDLNDLKKLTLELLKNGNSSSDVHQDQDTQELVGKIYEHPPENKLLEPPADEEDTGDEPSLSLETKEIEMIQKAIAKHEGKRKEAARELGISERTLYRKIKQYDM